MLKIRITFVDNDKGKEELKDALDKITNCVDNLKASEYENIYHSKYINYRDREILKYYIQNYVI